MTKYLPEGKLISTKENRKYIQSEQCMSEALAKGIILEALALVCDNDHNITVDLPCGLGVIPRVEGAVGIADGTTRDIALLSRVNKPVCFKVIGISHNIDGVPIFTLSRRMAQEECLANYISQLIAGEIIPAKVTHLEPFGAFVDIGCGISSLIPIDAISISRISHPNDRFYNGQDILAVVKANEGDRIYLSHKELLGTWEENASLFQSGETVGGIVRSIESYGIFIELTPNLAGLAELKENVYPGQSASVYIKAIIPEKMKVKLIIVDVFDNGDFPIKNKYFIDSGKIKSWKYSTPLANKVIQSEF